MTIEPRRFVGDTLALTIASLAGAALNLAQGTVVARWLGPKTYGAAALVIGFPTLVHTVLDTRAGEVLVRYLSSHRERNEPDKGLAVCRLGYLLDVGSAAVAMLAVAATARWAAIHIMHAPHAAGLVILYASSLIPGALSGSSQAVLSSFGRFHLIALIETVTTVTRAVLLVTMVLLGWEVRGIVWSNAMAHLLGGILYGSCAHAVLKHAWRRSWLQSEGRLPAAQRRELLQFIAYNGLNATLGTIPKQLDLVALGYLRGPTETGYYKLAKSFSAAFGYLVRPMQIVVYPMLAQLSARPGRSALGPQIRWIVLRMGAPLAMAGALTVLAVPVLIRTVVGSSYSPAILATQILLIGSVVWLAFFWVKPAYFALGRIWKWTSINLVIAVLSLAGIAISIPVGGYIGLAIWQATMHLLGHALAVFALKKEGHTIDSSQ
ncbi:MAG: oligosaccharide flippase family protein [bacterium]|nr:oligosaccharide flippase family protein [bacterium]